MIEIVLVHREVAVSRATHGAGDIVEADRHRERDDVDPGRHHLPGGGVAHRVEALANLQLLFGHLRRRLMAVSSNLATELHLPRPADSGKLEVSGEWEWLVGSVIERPVVQIPPWRRAGFVSGRGV